MSRITGVMVDPETGIEMEDVPEHMHFIPCPECGKEYDRRYLDQVVEYMSCCKEDPTP